MRLCGVGSVVLRIFCPNLIGAESQEASLGSWDDIFVKYCHGEGDRHTHSIALGDHPLLKSRVQSYSPYVYRWQKSCI